MRLVLVAADTQALPFDESTFDVAIAVTALCFVRAPQQAVSEIARVLRPGGTARDGRAGSMVLYREGGRHDARRWSAAPAEGRLSQSGISSRPGS